MARDKRFVDDEAGYLRWVGDHPDGFVVNTYRQPRADYFVLHRSTCGSIRGAPARGVQWTADYIKVCGDVPPL